MTIDEMAKLLVWSYQEGYKSAMNVIDMVASDRSQDEIFSQDMEKKMRVLLEEKMAKKG